MLPRMIPSIDLRPQRLPPDQKVAFRVDPALKPRPCLNRYIGGELNDIRRGDRIVLGNDELVTPQRIDNSSGRWIEVIEWHALSRMVCFVGSRHSDQP